MRCFIQMDTGVGRTEDYPSGSEFPDVQTAQRAAIAKARDFLAEHARQSRLILPQFFVEVRHESGELLSMLSLRRILFCDPITDRHRGLFDAIPHPCLWLNRHLAILYANPHYLHATFKGNALIAGLDMFDAFPDNPNDPHANGVNNLSISLHQVLDSRQPHRMPQQRYDIRTRSGPWLLRYWRPINVPVLDNNGEVSAIIHHVEEVTGPSASTSARGHKRQTSLRVQGVRLSSR